MNWPRIGAGTRSTALLASILVITLIPTFSSAQEFKQFASEEYGFTMNYPAAWVKIDKPKGNYYVMFQDPDLTENFRSRIHVAAHKPVTDPINVFLQELRNGIADLQKKSPADKDKQEVRILDEGEFKCDVPGAYYFYIQAYENQLRIWMDIVIVFYKHDQTLLRVSCLAPSKGMDKFQAVFNDILLSVRFVAAPAPGIPPFQTQPAPSPAPPAPRVTPAPPQVRPAPPAVQEPETVPGPPGLPRTPEAAPPAPVVPAPSLQPREPIQPAPAPRPGGPRSGPGRAPERPATGTGIVN